MIVVTEFLGGGELFERVASEDYNLTELDCTSFLRYLIIQRYILFFPMINTYSLEMGIMHNVYSTLLSLYIRGCNRGGFVHSTSISSIIHIYYSA